MSALLLAAAAAPVGVLAAVGAGPVGVLRAAAGVLAVDAPPTAPLLAVTAAPAGLFLLAAVAGYLVGALSPATVLARRRGIDLRAVGSGNPGATNAGRALGRRTGVLVAVLDMLKGLLPAVGFGMADHRAGLVAGLAAVLGHVTSPFLRGRGGKGVATAAGAILGSQPLWAPVVIVVWIAAVLVLRWVALASVLAALSVLVVAVVRGEDELWAAVLSLVVVVRHQPNVRRRLEDRRRGPAPQ